MHFFELHLHILTHFQIERCQRFIQQQHFRLIHDGAGNSYTLLLTTGKRIHIAVFIIRHAYHFQSSFHLLLNGLFRCFFQFQAESDVIIHIQVREQGIFLKYRIHRTLMGRSLCYFHPRNSDFAFRSCLKTSNETQQRGFTATGRTKYSHKLALFHVQSHIIQCCFIAKVLRYMAHLNDGFIFLHIHTKVWAAKVHISAVSTYVLI